jgi:hypothetical protein
MEQVNMQNLKTYYTDPKKWVCACDAFLTSRFMICKHILHCYERISNPQHFFQDICRRRTVPFWTTHGRHGLILRPEYDSDHGGKGNENMDSESSDCDLKTEDDTTSGIESDLDEDNHDSEGDALDDRVQKFETVMHQAMALFQEQKAKGNVQFVEKFMAANHANLVLLEEIQRLKNRRTMPQTWGKRQHPATMYYK